MKVRYSLHGVRFSIDADGCIAGEISRTVMPGCVSGARRGGRDHAAFVVCHENGCFSVRRGRKLLWSVRSEAELIPWLESEVVNWLLEKFRRYVQLHSAVVERRGTAALIAGAPDSGKTSLACALGLAGWGVMSDEVALVEPGFALVEPRGLAVAAFPRAMLVRTGTARRLRALLRFKPRRVVLDEGASSVRYVNPVSLGGKVNRRARIRALAFPEWSRKSSVGVMGEREAIERLLDASFNIDRRPKVSVDTCVGLVRNARLLRVAIGDLRKSARLLSEAIEAER